MKILIETKRDGNVVHHDFKIYNTEDANLNDFHLFCLSIVKDLLSDKHKIDQFMGEYKYNFNFNEEETEGLMAIMNYMANVIYNEPTNLTNTIANN